MKRLKLKFHLVQRRYYDGTWYWERVNGGIKAMKAWIPLPEPYRV